MVCPRLGVCLVTRGAAPGAAAAARCCGKEEEEDPPCLLLVCKPVGGEGGGGDGRVRQEGQQLCAHKKRVLVLFIVSRHERVKEAHPLESHDETIAAHSESRPSLRQATCLTCQYFHSLPPHPTRALQDEELLLLIVPVVPKRLASTQYPATRKSCADDDDDVCTILSDLPTLVALSDASNLSHRKP